ncbi:MAG TPA: branched-chain amino acid ABC transporter substrate-binding protein [Candidatus Binatia bacterium]|nr:branched-chain amino acid ABC transporter substrate-binding protein [Candidatus Binatia bacterium]
MDGRDLAFDDPRDAALVRALREDPLPEQAYWPGTFAERRRSGDIGRTAPSPIGPARRGFGAGSLGLAGVLVAIVLVAGGLLYRGGLGPTSPGASPTQTARPASAPPSASPSAAPTLGSTIRIGVSVPLSSDPTSLGDSVRDGALLAIAEANERRLFPGVTIGSVVLDHSAAGGDEVPKGTADMSALVADPTVVGVVGPTQSAVAEAQIPIGNAAGLLQCSPSASDPDLTKGPLGQSLRVTAPDRIAFLRLSPTDDDVAPGLADFAFGRLGTKRAFVVDDGAAYGMSLADAFAARFATDGGTVVGRETTVAGTTDYSAVLSKAVDVRPDIVMFGGVNAFGGDAGSGAGAFRRQMSAAGLGAVPLIGGDGLKDVDRTGASLIDIAGRAANGTYSADLAPTDYPGGTTFDAAFAAMYGRAPAPFAGPGYACAQVLLQAIATAVAAGDLTRDGVRAAGADTGTTFTTALGSLRFDAAGDVTTPTIGLDSVDLTANGGKGGWVVVHR